MDGSYTISSPVPASKPSGITSQLRIWPSLAALDARSARVASAARFRSDGSCRRRPRDRSTAARATSATLFFHCASNSRIAVAQRLRIGAAASASASVIPWTSASTYRSEPGQVAATSRATNGVSVGGACRLCAYTVPGEPNAAVRTATATRRAVMLQLFHVRLGTTWAARAGSRRGSAPLFSRRRPHLCAPFDSAGPA